MVPAGCEPDWTMCCAEMKMRSGMQPVYSGAYRTGTSTVRWVTTTGCDSRIHLQPRKIPGVSGHTHFS